MAKCRFSTFPHLQPGANSALRDSDALEVLWGVPLDVTQGQFGHGDLGVTSIDRESRLTATAV